MELLSYFPEWVLTHGPALLVVLPLLVAVITALLPSEKIAWLATILTAAMSIFLSVGALQYVLSVGPINYAMGGWEPPLGIGYHIDGLNAPVLLLISAVAFLCTLYALPSVVAEVEPKKRAPFYAAFLVSLAGLLGIVATGDAFNVFVFLEVSSISTYVLVGMGASRDRRALASAYNYLIMGSIGATFFVIGIGFLYMQTGTLNMLDMAQILQQNGAESRVTKLGFAFVVIGLGLKLAMFPLHTWLPGAYAYAPSFFTAFLAATATKAALYLLLRFVFTVFDVDWGYVAGSLTYLIAVLAVIGMLAASLQAIFQKDIRRVLAYSSVAQVGYMLLGIGMATTLGLTGGYLHLINHAMIKGALFLAVGAFWYRFGITQVADMRGLGKTMPWTTAGFTIAGLSLIGVPGTVGFVSKLTLVRAAAENEWWWAVAMIALTSILAIIYLGRLIECAYFHAPPKYGAVPAKRNEAPLMMLIPLWVLAISAIVFGINAEWTTSLAEAAVRVLDAGPNTMPLIKGGH
ncbi:MAG: monovalent cation/H+ antiporter subunit D family protein [Hyphomonadaceae bacterium]|nr:monovalent cation/H+ antiporter subunit D family protein [Hyphomonadaceae bacterium]